MELIRHAANNPQKVAAEHVPWQRYEFDIWSDWGRLRVHHDRHFGPLVVGKRGLRPVFDIEFRALYLEEYLAALPRERYTIPGRDDEYERTPPLLIDLKGRWKQKHLELLIATLKMEGKRYPQAPFDIFCTQAWQHLETLASLGIRKYQICYSAGTVPMLRELAPREDVQRISVDYRILQSVADLDVFHERMVKIFLWGLPNDFYKQEFFLALKTQGPIAGLTLDHPPAPNMYN